MSGSICVEKGIEKARLFPSYRLLLGILTCLAIMILNFLRINLSLSIVCMVKPTLGSGQLPLNTSIELFSSNYSTNESRVFDVNMSDPAWESPYEGEFDWSRQLQGVILSAYFYGYIVTQIIGGWLAGRFGGKHVLGSGMIAASVATVVTPAIARFNPYCLIIIRAIVGAGTGLIIPSIQSFWGVWAPPTERSFLSSISFSGGTIGAIIAVLISSQFCTIQFDNGWPMAFYVTGGCGCIFWVVWNLLAFSLPEQNPHISQKELNYIRYHTGTSNVMPKCPRVQIPFPWLKALTSLPVIAIIVSQTTFTWFAYTGLTSMPLYFRDVLKFNISQNGLFMGVQYAGVLVTSAPIAIFADFLVNRKFLTIESVRKLYQTVCAIGCAILLVILAYMDHERRYIAVFLLILIAIFQTFARCGFLVNPQDIAPRFAGVIFGIAGTFGTLSGILAPVAVGNLTVYGTQEEWKTVFFIAAAMFVLGGVVFAVFAKGEIQPWAKAPSDLAPMEILVNNSSGNSSEEKSNENDSMIVK